MADDDDTDCTLCYEAYSDSDEGRIPRNLSCGHTYCTECMRNLRDNTDGSDSDDNMGFKLIDEIQSRIRCPQCKMMTEIRNGDVSNLAKNYALLNLMEKMKNLQVTAEGSRKYKCPEHSSEDLRYWCSNSDCQKPVCSRCLLEGKHQGHMFSPLSDISGTKRETLQEKLTEASRITAVMEGAFENVSSEINNLCKLGESAKEKIKEKFEGMRSSLDKREKVLLGTIESYIEDTQETLEYQKQFLEEHLKRAKEVCKEAEQIANGHDLEVLSKFKQSTGQMWELVDAFQEVVTEPLVRPVIRFRSETRDIMQQIERYGELCFEEQKPLKQAMRAVEQGVPLAKKTEGAQGGALARQPLQRRAEKGLVVETLCLDSLCAKPPTGRDPNWVEDMDHGVAASRVESPPSPPPPSRRVQQTRPSAPPIRRDDESPQIPGLRLRSRAPTQMSLLHTVTSSPPPPHAARALPEVVPSHSPPRVVSWKERVSYVNQLTLGSDDNPESDCTGQVDYPTDSHHGNQVEALIPAALPPVVSSTGGGGPKELCVMQNESSWGVGVQAEGGDSATPPEELSYHEDIWSAAKRPQ